MFNIIFRGFTQASSVIRMRMGPAELLSHFATPVFSRMWPGGWTAEDRLNKRPYYQQSTIIHG